MEDIEEFEVQAIRAKVKLGRNVYYLVKWQGFNEEANTWEPADHVIGCSEIIEDFEAQSEGSFKPCLSTHYWPLFKQSALPKQPHLLKQVGSENWTLLQPEVSLVLKHVEVEKVLSHYYEVGEPHRLMFMVRVKSSGRLPPLSMASLADLEKMCPDMLITYLLSCLDQ